MANFTQIESKSDKLVVVGCGFDPGHAKTVPMVPIASLLGLGIHGWTLGGLCRPSKSLLHSGSGPRATVSAEPPRPPWSQSPPTAPPQGVPRPVESCRPSSGS